MRAATRDRVAAALLAAAVAAWWASWSRPPALSREALADLLVRAHQEGVAPLDAARRAGLSDHQFSRTAAALDSPALEEAIAARLRGEVPLGPRREAAPPP